MPTQTTLVDVISNVLYTHRIGGSRNVNTIDEFGSKKARNSVIDSHLSPNWRQMAIENTVSSDFGSARVDC